MIIKRRYPSGRLGLALVVLLLSICLLASVYAGELPDSHSPCISCKGTLSPLGRWCNNGDGTVTDMTTGLIWLKDAAWGGEYPVQTGSVAQVTAYDRVSQVKNGNPASLTDGSALGDWRLPSLEEFKAVVGGTEAIVMLYGLTVRTYFFTNPSWYGYWTGTSIYRYVYDTTFMENYNYAVRVSDNGYWEPGSKDDTMSVWPVRDPK
ncbi:MAG: DUF1566 domain-containing protein [Deltaproteobacteria bacterium]|nr:DUF1566 domain-containing protein [Deltaproteobacteria bacterium]